MYWLRRTKTAKVVVTATSNATPTTTAERGDLDGPDRLGRFRGEGLVLMWRRRSWARPAAGGDCGEIGSLRQITTAPRWPSAAMSNWGVVPDVGPGLCATCAHVETIRSDRGSVFFRCSLSDIDPRFPKYPTLPVVECSGWDSVRNSERGPREPQIEDE